jgi:hypothetical protein
VSNNKFPENPDLGDMVAFTNRVLQVWVGNQWYLLGGEKLSLVNYNRAIDYLLTGWGESQSVLEYDLDSLIQTEREPYYKSVFITRCLDANQKVLDYQALVDEAA